MVQGYNNTQIQEQNFSTPGTVSAPLEAFGGGSVATDPNKALQAASDTVTGIAEKSYQAATLAANTQNKNEVQSFASNSLYGTTDPTGKNIPGFIQSINGAGQDAHGMYDKLQQTYNDFVSQKMATLPNTDQRNAFANDAADQWRSINRVAQTHLAAEQTRFEKTQFDSSLDNAVNLGVHSYSDDDAVQNSSEQIITETQKYGMTHGWSDQEMAAVQGDKTSQLYSGVVQRYFANGQAAQGKEYYDSVKDKITDSKTNIMLDKLVQDGTTQSQAQSLANKISSEHSDDYSAMAAVDEIKDPQLQDAVRSRVKSQIAINNQQTQVARDNVVLQASDAVTKGGSFDSIPLALQQQLTPDAKKALQKLADNSSGAIPIKNNDAVFNKYSSMQPGALAKVSQAEMITDVRSNVDDYHWKQIQDQWLQSQQGIGGNQVALAKSNQVTQIDGIMLQSFTGARIAGAQDGQKYNNFQEGTRKAYNDYKQEVQVQIDSATENKGKPLSPPEVREISQRVANQKVFTVQPGTFWDSTTDKNMFQLTPEEKQNFRVRSQNIPTDQMQKLYQAGLQSGGIPIGTPYDVATSKYKSSFEKAYGAAVRGADMNQIRSIMGGQ